jgi:phosphoribosylanthranilate isomerase
VSSPTTRVKIDGLRDTESALVAARAGADFLGFVFVEGVRRQLQPIEGQAIVRAFRIRGYPRSKKGPGLAGLFSNQPADFVNRVTRDVDLDHVQLCGEEDETYLRSMWKPVIRQVHVRPADTADSLKRQVMPHLDAGRMVVLDRYDAKTPGGSGKTFDWLAAEGLVDHEGVLLAGGLTPENVGGAVERLRPWGVDVSSGVETNGVKDHAKIEAFIAAAKGARAAR